MSEVFDIGVEVDGIQEAELLPVDWYTVEIVQDRDGKGPYKEANKAMKEDPGAEKAGYNLVINVRVYEPDIPEFNNRAFRLWLSLPTPNDEETFTAGGQKTSHMKASSIFNISAGFQGIPREEMEGSTVSFPVGSRAKMYVTQEIAQFGRMKGQLVNTLDSFAGAKPMGEDD